MPKTGKAKQEKCEYPGCTMQVGHTTEKCWENQKNIMDRPVKWVSFIKKNHVGLSEASTVEIILQVQYKFSNFGHEFQW